MVDPVWYQVVQRVATSGEASLAQTADIALRLAQEQSLSLASKFAVRLVSFVDGCVQVPKSMLASR
jgi:hypothetical protein